MRMVVPRASNHLIAGTYYFDQFNIKVDMPKYTEEEYEKYLQGIISIYLS